MSKVKVEHWNDVADGPLTKQNMMKKLRSDGYDCCDYTFVPGVVFPDHTHDVTKRDAVISGRFLIGMGGQEVILEAGDSVLIPAGAVHNAKVIGSEPVLFIDASKR